MEINPFESRLRMLQQIETVAMQREAAPDEETAGCPGCPYFWTCPVPHRGEEVRAPQEPPAESAAEALPGRRDFVPRDESDVGWTDVWVDEDGLRLDEAQVEELRREEPREETEAAPAEDAPGPRRRWWRRRR